MGNLEYQKNTSEKTVEDKTGKEEIAQKIEALKKQEGVKKFERELEQAGEAFEKVAEDPMLKDETMPVEQKQKFWEKTRKLRIFMPLVVSGIMSLAGLFGKGNAEGQNLSNTQGPDSWNNLMKIGTVVSDMDKKQQIKMEKAAHPFEKSQG